MKLCFLASAASIHSYRWIKFFADKGYETYWISLTSNIFGDINGVRFYQFREFPAKVLDVLFNVVLVRRLIKKINPDILHAHYAGIYGILGALSGFHPYILTAWGSDVLIVPNSRTAKPLIKFVLKGADLITCDADHMKDAIVKLGVSASKIKIIYFGVDTKKFSPGLKDENIIKELGIQDSLVVISLRNLEPIYNIETLIKAIPLVLKEISNVKFIIAGKGSEEKKLKRLVKKLGLESNIKFVGFIPNYELPTYLRVADVYVSTSLSDAGIAASTAEAMACKLPVVVTNTGENKKWIQDNKGGYLIPIKTPKILAEKIICLLEDENRRRSFGEINRKTIEEKNDYYKEMIKVKKIYEEIVKRN